jgi:hypothetical protein
MFSRVWRAAFLWHLLVTPSDVSAQRVQYCRFGSDAHFCAAIVAYRNHSMSTYDLYINFVSRVSNSGVGWTALGIGPSMAESLMLIAYGDPSAPQPPTISFRTTTGYHQPRPLTRDDIGGADVRLLGDAVWIHEEVAAVLPSTAHFIGNSGLSVRPPRAILNMMNATIACYSCSLWPNSSMSTVSSAQQMIWAWNEDQVMQGYDTDVILEMHKTSSAPGMGIFEFNLQQSINSHDSGDSTLVFPAVHFDVTTVGAWDVSLEEKRLTKVYSWLLWGFGLLVAISVGFLAVKVKRSRRLSHRGSGCANYAHDESLAMLDDPVSTDDTDIER